MRLEAEVAMAALLLLACLVQDEDADEAVRRKLATKIAISMRETAIPDAFEFVREFLDITFRYDAAAGEYPKELKVSIDGSDCTAGEAIREALLVHELDYTVFEGAVLVTSKKGRVALEGAPKDADLKKDKELWKKLAKEAGPSKEATLAEVLAKLAEISGLAIKSDALDKAALKEKIGVEPPSRTVLGALRYLGWARSFTFEVKEGSIVLAPRK
jgi:hypothetical protein